MSMKIGILTYHRTHNFGGCLQAIATRIVLEQMGHRVFYIDYWPEYHSFYYEPFSLKKLCNAPGVKFKLKIAFETLRYGKFISKRQRSFNKFISNEITLFCKPLNEEYDVVIYGSDQIWRKQPILNTYNPVYFADNSIKAKKHIAFSASMGIMPTLESEKNTLSHLLSHFDHISVREKELRDYCASITDKQVFLTIDPTLLISKNQWSHILLVDKYEGPRYVLVYALHNTFNIDSINGFAKRRNLMVKTIYRNAIMNDTNSSITTADPREFVRLVKNADFIFSSSFHGLAFSLIFEKEFLVSFGSNAGRAKSLLSELGLSDRFINPKVEIPESIIPIDYALVQPKLCYLQRKSLEYLTNALK